MTLATYTGNIPNRLTGAETFSADADYYHAYFTPFIAQFNADIAALNLNSVQGSSTTSNTIGTGLKTFTVNTGKSFQAGQYLIFADSAAPTTNSMVVQVQDYNSSTGVMNILCVAFTGSGTKTSWVVSLTAAPSQQVSTSMQPVTSALSLSAGRIALGATATGDALFTTASPLTARTTLGASTVGNGVFTAVSAAAALALLDAARPSFSAYQSVAQSIPNTTLTKLQFQTEEHDSSSAFVNDRFTPQVSGEYQISAGVGFADFRADLFCIIYKNGVEIKRGARGNLISCVVTHLVYLNGTTDYLEVFVYQNSGASQNTRALIAETYFSGVLVKAR